MTTRCVLAVGLLVLATVVGCGEAQDTASVPARLAVADDAAPLGPGAVDPGILQDPTGYQPAQPPTGEVAAGGSTPAAGGGETPADTATWANTLAEDLVNFLRDGEVEMALGLFNPEHVAAVGDEALNALYNTADTLTRLSRTLEDKLGEDEARALMAIPRQTEVLPSVELVNPTQATLTPNAAGLLLGNVKESPSLIAEFQDGRWRLQLDGPLTADDVADIVAYHEKLRSALNEVIDWVEASDPIDVEQLRDALRNAAEGEPVEVGAP